jgi:hypothetical protein
MCRKEGFHDGLSILRIENVVRVCVGDEYLRAMQIIMQTPPIEFPSGLEIAQPLSLTSTFEAAIGAQAVVSVLPYDGDNICGIPVEVGSDGLYLEELSDFGLSDGFTTLRFDTIERVDIAGAYEISLMRLRRNHLDTV